MDNSKEEHPKFSYVKYDLVCKMDSSPCEIGAFPFDKFLRTGNATAELAGSVKLQGPLNCGVICHRLGNQSTVEGMGSHIRVHTQLPQMMVYFASLGLSQQLAILPQL